MSQALSIRSRPATFSIVDDAHGEAYAPEPASLRSRILAPSSCESCGIRTPPGESLCEKCASDRKLATADLGSISVDGLESSPVPGGRRPLFAPGQAFGPRYTIIEQVGSGGMGTVYKARDSETGRTVALKLIRPDVISRVGALSRFKRELSLAQTVSHPNVYRVHDLGDVDGNAYISMEYIEGQSLDDLIHSMGHLSPRQTVAIGRQICGGLHAIHEKAIVHRDLKPSNIMVDHAGVARLMDFGLAYQTGSEHLTSEGQVLGTMAYLSPEQARGEQVAPPSDVFALGLILYEMLTGKRPPGDGKPIPLALRGIIEPCPKPSHFVPEIPKVIDNIVMKCLERDPEKRFPSAEALGSALEAVAAGQTTRIALGNLRRGSGPYEVTRARPWRWIVATVAVSVTVLAAVPIVRTRAMALVGFATATPPRSSQAVAVLPLKSLGGAGGEDLGVGIADLLGADLEDAGCGSVIAHSTIAGLNAGAGEITSVAKGLGATRVVTGTVDRTRSPTQVELIVFGANGEVLNSFTGVEQRGIADLQRSLSDKLVAALCVGLNTKGRGTPPITASTAAFLDYSRGLRLLDDPSRQPEEAVEALKSATAQDPAFGLAHAALADAYWAVYLRDKDGVSSTNALSSALRAQNLAGDRPKVGISLAVIQLGLGQTDAALEQIHKVLLRAPRSDQGFQVLSDILAAKGDLQGAIEAIQNAIDIRPNYWGYYNALGFIHYGGGHWDPALKAFQAVIERQPNEDVGHMNEGMTHYQMGNLERAVASYEKARSLRPSATALGNIGEIQYERGDFAAAARAFEGALTITPKNVTQVIYLGNAYAKLSRTDAAKREWGRAASLARDQLRLNENDARTRSLLAVSLAKLGQFSDADASIAAALQLAPRDKDVWLSRARVESLSGRLDAAVESLERAVTEGYSPLTASRDDDLAALRGRPELRRLISHNP